MLLAQHHQAPPLRGSDNPAPSARRARRSRMTTMIARPHPVFSSASSIILAAPASKSPTALGAPTMPLTSIRTPDDACNHVAKPDRMTMRLELGSMIITTSDRRHRASDVDDMQGSARHLDHLAWPRMGALQDKDPPVVARLHHAPAPHTTLLSLTMSGWSLHITATHCVVWFSRPWLTETQIHAIFSPREVRKPLLHTTRPESL